MRPCFNDFITYRGGGISKSGLYIDDLPGIPVDLLNKLRNCKEESSLSLFWSRFYVRCVSNFTSLVTGKVGSKFYTGSVVESRITGEFGDDNNTTSEEYAGVKLSLPQSRYLENQILTIKLSVESFGSPEPNIYVFDKVGGSIVETIDLEGLTTGINVFNVFKTYENEYLYIAYKPSEIVAKETSTYHRYHDGQNRSTTLASQINGGGLIVEFNNYCSIEKFICSRIQSLKYAFWYHIGAELMKERILSETINRYTTLTEEKAEQLGGIWEEELNQKLDSALRDMKINDDKLCMDCRGVVARKTLLP